MERGDFAATVTRGFSRNIPSALFQNPSFLDKAAVFKFQDAPELFTLKCGPGILMFKPLILPAERGDSWAMMGLAWTLGETPKGQKTQVLCSKRGYS